MDSEEESKEENMNNSKASFVDSVTNSNNDSVASFVDSEINNGLEDNGLEDNGLEEEISGGKKKVVNVQSKVGIPKGIKKSKKDFQKKIKR